MPLYDKANFVRFPQQITKAVEWYFHNSIGQSQQYTPEQKQQIIAALTKVINSTPRRTDKNSVESVLYKLAQEHAQCRIELDLIK